MSNTIRILHPVYLLASILMYLLHPLQPYRFLSLRLLILHWRCVCLCVFVCVCTQSCPEQRHLSQLTARRQCQVMLSLQKKSHGCFKAG